MLGRMLVVVLSTALAIVDESECGAGCDGDARTGRTLLQVKPAPAQEEFRYGQAVDLAEKDLAPEQEKTQPSSLDSKIHHLEVDVAAVSSQIKQFEKDGDGVTAFSNFSAQTANKRLPMEERMSDLERVVVHLWNRVESLDGKAAKTALVASTSASRLVPRVEELKTKMSMLVKRLAAIIHSRDANTSSSISLLEKWSILDFFFGPSAGGSGLDEKADPSDAGRVDPTTHQAMLGSVHDSAPEEETITSQRLKNAVEDSGSDKKDTNRGKSEKILQVLKEKSELLVNGISDDDVQDSVPEAVDIEENKAEITKKRPSNTVKSSAADVETPRGTVADLAADAAETNKKTEIATQSSDYAAVVEMQKRKADMLAREFSLINDVLLEDDIDDSVADA